MNERAPLPLPRTAFCLCVSSGSNRTKRLITFQPSLSSPGIIFRALYRAGWWPDDGGGGGGDGGSGGTSILTSNREGKKYRKYIYISLFLIRISINFRYYSPQISKLNLSVIIFDYPG